MNANCELLTPTFALEAAFEARVCRTISRASEDSQFEMPKARLLRQTLNGVAIAGADGFIRLAANDVAAFAWDSHFPLLVFPRLFEEKANAVLARARQQVTARRRSLELLAA